MSRPLKTYNNSAVCTFLHQFYTPSDLCEAYPPIDDIFTGLLQARTAGDTASRSLSRHTLFRILSRCPVIDTGSVSKATNYELAPRTVSGYAAIARAASLFIRQFMARLPPSEDDDDDDGVSGAAYELPNLRESLGGLSVAM